MSTRHRILATAAACVLVVLAAGTGAIAQVLQQSPWTNAGLFSGGQKQAGDTGSAVLGQPASFSLRPTYVTGVRDQGDCGSCWAFAAYGAMESNLLMQSEPADDLSENHLKNYHGFDYGPCEGGNNWMSIAYLSRLDGPVAEADDPYHDWDDRPSPGGPRQYFLNRAKWLAPSQIKFEVMATGAVSVAMHMDTAYYDPVNYTYYYNGAELTNHAVNVVGWDDAKVVAGAPNPGAWQIRNSWGAGWGDGGYFWVSYDDAKACEYGYTFEAAPPETVTGVYSHDEFGQVTSMNNAYAMNVFQATAEAGQELKSVGFYTQADGAGYEIRIYDTLSGGAPSVLLATKSGTIDIAGYNVVELDSTVPLPAGDDFVIYVHITAGGTYPHAIDYRLAGYNSSSSASAGESFYSLDGVTWGDLTLAGFPTANYSIKGFIIPEPATLSLLALGGLALIRRRRR